MDNNLVAFSLAQISRYLRFLEIPRSRYRSVSEEVAARSRRRMAEAATDPGPRELTAAEIADLDRDEQLHLSLHFEIESFFLFAKIFLDKVARFVQDFFGGARGLSLRSHDNWCSDADAYARAKGLAMPSGMLDTMQRLRSLVADYRDKQIAHLQNPRAMHGTQIRGNGSTQIAGSALFPTARDKQVMSPEIDQVWNLIETYVEQLIAMVETNRDKTRYKIAAGG
jgi:hypothetical protein